MRKFEVEAIVEFSLDVNGWNYLVIYGKHVNGYFCCIPNWKISCEMAGPELVGYNSSKLMECDLDEEIATKIAESILEAVN